VGTIVDGAIRDLDEMTYAGFKALARRLCVGHAHSIPVQWDCTVEVFGTHVDPGQLIHADKHGFIALPKGDQPKLLSAASYMDALECQTVIQAARSCAGLPPEAAIQQIDDAAAQFKFRAQAEFGKHGEH
jgi:regulator of RNase E activity RraA